MKIAVCLKRVPDTEMRLAIAADGKSIDPAGLKFDMSDFDGYAAEVALRLKEKTGQGATDTGNGTVGAMTAGLLGLPCVTAVSQLEIEGASGTARRDLEGAVESVTFPLPAVLTIDEGIARARIPSLKGIMAAKKKPLDSRPAQLGEVRLTVERLEFPPERPAGRIVGEGPDAVPELVRLLREEAKVV
jgi:electron transfer flavoprotein beta subunit